MKAQGKGLAGLPVFVKALLLVLFSAASVTAIMSIQSSRLIHRLTEEGMALIERAEELEAAARAFESGLPEEPKVSGTVRLATAENLATALILPALPRLRRLATLRNL